jgi:hypothetical protein
MLKRCSLLALILGLLVPSAGGGTGGAQDGPGVVRTLPLDGMVNVPRNAQIRVYFDHPMDRGSFDDNFEIRIRGGDIVDWNGRLEGKETVFVAEPTSNLPSGRTIDVVLDHGITDGDGNPLEDDNGDGPGAHAFHFTTGSHTDTDYPGLTDVEVYPNPTFGADELTLICFADDSLSGGSTIGGAEYFVDSVGMNGEGFPLEAVNGYDDVVEWIRGEVDASGWLMGSVHFIYVHAMDLVGNWSELTPVGVYTEGGKYLDEDRVYVWPNPAGERATFTFTVGGDSRVRLVVYDLAGREVFRDSGEFLTGDKGEFVWELAGVASDVYLFRLTAEETTGQLRRASVVKKLAVVR